MTLTADARHGWEALVRRPTAAQPVAVRARMILAAADGFNHAQMARQLGIEVDTVRLWRQRWLGFQAVSREDRCREDRLTDAPRPGRPARITAAHVCQVIALACEAPTLSGRPISPWTRREVAEELVTRGLVAHLSPRHAARLVKRGP